MSGTVVSKISWAERERIAKRNRSLLDRELLEKRLTFESGPYEAHVQFSNFCNMSCIMCWDGENPPLKRMDPEVLAKVRGQIAPTLSVITPHSASEPLVASWDETLAFVRDYSVQLALTTNTQFLDRAKLEEIKDHVEMVVMSIDSHIPEVFEKIRPGGKSDKVFANLPGAAAFCAEHGIECMVQVVFMTENAASMPETVAYMADAGVTTVNVIQLIDTNRRSSHLDATLHFSSAYLERLKQQCLDIARRRRIRLGWDLDGPQFFDFREPARRVGPRRSKAWNDRFDHDMHLRHPGFCKYAYDRLQIELDGNVEPCGLATEGELVLGNLKQQDFEEIWNGPPARDLRRAHYTWDYPSLCASCRYVDRLGPQDDLPFATMQDAFLRENMPQDVDRTLEVETPEHMARVEEPPVFRFARPGRPVRRYVLLLSLGGDSEHVERVRFTRAVRRDDGTFELALPADVWERLDTNVGWWWALWAVSNDEAVDHLRSKEVRCLIRHEALPRIQGSTLGYADEGHLAPVYLGGERQVGWQEHRMPPPRPALRERRETPGRRRRSRGAQVKAPKQDAVGGTGPDEYARLTADLLKATRRAVPEGARVLVVSRGDDALTDAEGREGWHFPCSPDGQWIGFHPPDAGWAIEHLEQQRAAGAQFIAFPSTAFWWLETYPALASHLDDHYVVAAENQSSHLIYDLRDPVVAVQPAAESTNGAGSARRAQPPIPKDRNMEERPRSLMHEADAVLGYGGHHRTALRPIYEGAGDVFPKFAVAAEGCNLTDTAGRTFIDWVGGGGPVLLGYRHPEVEEAVRAQLEAGPTLTLMHPVEVEVATLLKEMVPCAEMVTFGKNGSDALAAGIRVARAATGREVILQYGVHGFHEWFTCMHPGVQGVPKVLRALVEPFRYNDLDALAEMFARHRGEVAAIVMEPMAFELPQPGYLEALIDMAHAEGALVLFDEMVTGLRLANGGAQELFGVTPDLACFGKALANGMPLSALVGAAKHMKLLPSVAYGMTFRGETLSLAAARAVLRALREQPVAQHVARIGAELRGGFDRACAEYGVGARLLGHESRMTLAFHDQAGIERDQAQALFLEGCAAHGVLTNGNLMPSAAHDDRAVERTLRAFENALSRIGELVTSAKGTLAEAIVLGFRAAGEDERWSRGSLDTVGAHAGRLEIAGWLLTEDGPPEVVEAVHDDGAIATARAVPRPDVARAHPAIPGAGMAGFNLSAPARDFARGDDYSFTLRARRGDHVIFSCRLARLHSEHQSAEHRPTLGEDGTLHL
jgi:radical SAM protein with 4Fe4S-binding SPASM domain